MNSLAPAPDFAKGASGPANPYDNSPSGLGLNPAYLAGGASATALSASGSGSEYAYSEFTSPMTVTATVEASATAIVAASAVTFDGLTDVFVEFFAPFVETGATNGDQVLAILFQDGTSIGQLGKWGVTSASQEFSAARVGRRVTPTAGSHTYSVGAIRIGTSNGIVGAGAGGVGALMPGYIRIVKA